jgi:hypothetical protein
MGGSKLKLGPHPTIHILTFSARVSSLHNLSTRASHRQYRLKDDPRNFQMFSSFETSSTCICLDNALSGGPAAMQ